jgi:hypothetical protein
MDELQPTNFCGTNILAGRIDLTIQEGISQQSLSRFRTKNDLIDS